MLPVFVLHASLRCVACVESGNLSEAASDFEWQVVMVRVKVRSRRGPHID